MRIEEPPLTDRARLCLITERVDDFRAGSDEGEAGLLDFAREASVLRKEAIAGERERKRDIGASVSAVGCCRNVGMYTQDESCRRHARERCG